MGFFEGAGGERVGGSPLSRSSAEGSSAVIDDDWLLSKIARGRRARLHKWSLPVSYTHLTLPTKNEV